MPEAIAIEHVTKAYGPGKGVFDASFAVESGEIFGFLGPNGAGMAVLSAALAVGFWASLEWLDLPHAGSAPS